MSDQTALNMNVSTAPTTCSPSIQLTLLMSQTLHAAGAAVAHPKLAPAQSAAATPQHPAELMLPHPAEFSFSEPMFVHHTYRCTYACMPLFAP